MKSLCSRIAFLLYFMVGLHSIVDGRDVAWDVNLIGFINDIRSVSRHTSSFIECLHDDATIKIFGTRNCSLQDFPAHYSKIIDRGIDLSNQKGIKRYINGKKALTGITIFTDNLYHGWDEYRSLCNKSTIKFAYCVAECSLIAPFLVTRLNSNFDALLVPDEWLVSVYKNSGITLPIFVLPEVLDLDGLLTRPAKTIPNKPFVFGFSGGFWPRKNHVLLMKAFVKEFGNNPDVMLKIHGRFDYDFEKMLNAFNKIKSENITLEQRAFSREEFQDFLTSLDCYVTISKAEGFSIIPREALAAGIPCIVSNNTAQTTICNSKCVYSVPSYRTGPYFYASKVRTYGFNCSIDDVRAGLRTVYKNYQHYLALAQKGREWAAQYCVQSLKPKYQTLIFPQAVILGDCNEITDLALITNSRELFERYRKLCTSTQTIFKEQ